MTQEESVKIFDLVIRDGKLPATLDELAPLSFIGQTAVNFYRDKVKLMDQLGMTEEQRAATLRDGQDAGKMLLEIETRIGELLPTAEETKRLLGKAQKGKTRGRYKGIHVLPENVDSKKAHTARTIAGNPEAVAAILKEAEDNDDIPTKTAVLNKVRAESERQRREQYEAQSQERRTENLASAKGEAAIYLSKLREVVLVLPAKVPSEGWSESSFAEASSMVAIIRKRLEVFDG